MGQSIVTALILIWTTTGCEFQDSSEQRPDSNQALSLERSIVVSWNDELRTRELARKLSFDNDDIRAKSPIPFSFVPEEVRVSGQIFKNGNSCSASLWIENQKLVRLECSIVPGSNEVLVRSLSKVIEGAKDSNHTLQISNESKRLSLSIRILPSQVLLTPQVSPASVRFLESTTPIHRVATLQLPSARVSDLKMSIATILHGTIERNFTVHSSEIGFCKIEPTTHPHQENIPIELKLVEDKVGLERDWPLWFSMERQILNLDRLSVLQVAVYTSSEFLDQFYSPSYQRELPTTTKVTSNCKTGDPGPGLGREEIGRMLPIGRTESPPVLKFMLTGIKVSDPKADALDTVPVERDLEGQSIEVQLKNGVFQ